MIIYKLLFTLIAVHALCDYPLQGDFIGKFKNRHMQRETFLQNKKHGGVPWWHLMTAHSLIHGLGVFAVTSNIYLATFETVAHFIIDVLKCEGYTNINVDQFLHILCKAGYVAWMLR